MNSFMKAIIFFAVSNFVLSEEIPDLVRVRTEEEANGAEFFALDTVGLIEKWGYPAEEYNVTTQDGYIINIFRIPWSPKSQNKTQIRPVVFFQIGMFVSSDIWIFFGENRSLALQLADEGYDIWIGNYRGNTYGRNHITLSPESTEFWDFSFHEVGIYDLPCMLDFTLNITHQSSLTLVVQSMGGSALFALLSEYPEYNSKIDMVIAFSPVGGWFAKHPMRAFISTFVHIWQDYFEPDGTVEIFPQSSVVAAFFKRICIANDIVDLCLLPLDLSVGKDRYQLDQSSIIELLCYTPSGASTKFFWHYRQLEQSQKFRQYDYENSEENMRHYGQLEPPEYNLKNIKSPLLIYYGNNDPITTKDDIDEMAARMSSNVTSELVQFEYFNHADFLGAIDVKKLLNDLVVERISQFRNESMNNIESRKFSN